MNNPRAHTSLFVKVNISDFIHVQLLTSETIVNPVIKALSSGTAIVSSKEDGCASPLPCAGSAKTTLVSTEATLSSGILKIESARYYRFHFNRVDQTGKRKTN
jgi:hypothetical protein